MKPTDSIFSSDPRWLKVLALQQSGQLEEAIFHIQELARLFPENPQLLIQAGILLQEARRPDQALTVYDRAMIFITGEAEIHFHRGNVLLDLRRLEEALASYNQAIALKPDYVQVYNNRGVVLYELGRWAEAVASFDSAIALKPAHASAHNNRANALKELDRLEEALKSYNQAIALNPGYVRAYNNRGVTLQGLGLWKEAQSSFDQAIALAPEEPAAYWNKAQLKNLLGDYAEGWRLFEWRWKEIQKNENRHFTQPLWLGAESLEGKTILIHAEQGLGDTIQFCRYIHLVERKGAKVIFEVPPALRNLMETLSGTRCLIGRGEPLPHFDLHCPMLSLPLALGTRVETIPADVPYLFVDTFKKSVWQKKLGAPTKPRVGLVWSGRAEHTNDRLRSFALENFKPLLELPYEFHSLQKEYRERDKASLVLLPVQDHQADLKDFSDTAALVSEMDLILSVDTSIAHLAGALGKPLWILLPYQPDYRWLLERNDSPWYPNATLFRQQAAGDWKSLILKVADQLKVKHK